MSRILVAGTYEDGNFVLRYAEGAERGEVYQTIVPNSVFSIGNQMGGFFARPVKYAGQHMLSLVLIGGGMKSRPVEQIARRTRGEKGFVLKPMTGLWATSSGSARRGIFHVVHEETDPIRIVLRRLGMPANLLTVVDAIDEEVMVGGRDCGHNPDPVSNFCLVADGEKVCVEEAPCNTNKFVHGSGSPCSLGPDRYRVSGGTFLIQYEEGKRNGGNYLFAVSRVIITAVADRNAVADRLVGARYRKGTDLGFLMALEGTAEQAASWIAATYRTVSSSELEEHFQQNTARDSVSHQSVVEAFRLRMSAQGSGCWDEKAHPEYPVIAFALKGGSDQYWGYDSWLRTDHIGWGSGPVCTLVRKHGQALFDLVK